jgi:kanamycin kinase/streptomycin 3"-kinase/aminoglycoside 3'-phosphotransferase-2
VHDWELVTTGQSDACVYRSPDGRSFAKTATVPAAVAELRNERDRLAWLELMAVNAPRVLDWQEQDGRSRMVTSTLGGVPASVIAAADAPTLAERLVEFLALLHRLPTNECPFDRRLTVTVPLAKTNVAAGLVDEADFDQERLGQTAPEVLGQLLAGLPQAQELEGGDLAVCHGDFCLPNVLVDPATLNVTGILDVARLGVADRHIDVALLARSMAASILNPNYGPDQASWLLQHTAADPWRINYYCLLDEFF